MKKMLATVAAGLALSGMVGIGLSAGLASPANAATPTTLVSSTTAGHHPLLAWLRAHRKAVARVTVAVSAKTIGITPTALVNTLWSGQSIAEVAHAHDVDAQTVVNALVHAGDSLIGRAVDNHTLTEAQGTKIDGVLPGLATKVVGHVFARHAG